jgi:ribose transport system permease protein
VILIPRKISWKTAVKNLYVLGVLALIIFIFSSISTKFIGVPNIINILRQSVPALLVGTSVTMVMISGNIDLSVGGVVGLSSVIYCILLKGEIPHLWAGLLTLALGVLIGAINGFLVMKVRIVPVIATLATMNLCIGFGKLLSPEGIGLIKGVPRGVEKFARAPFLFRLPVALYVAVFVIALLVILQRKTVLGKYASAIGGNRTAAELSGINVVNTVWLLYIIAGLCSSLGGVSRASYLSLGDPATGMGMELDAIIAVVLGGTNYFGGEGSVARTTLGVLIIMCLTAGIQVAGMEPYWDTIIKGIALIFALIIDCLVKEKIMD